MFWKSVAFLLQLFYDYSPFSIFRLSTIFLIISDTEIVFIGKFYTENIFLDIFLTKFEAGIAKNQNFGDNSFFKLNVHCNLKCRSKIFCTIWGAENLCRVIFKADKHVDKITANSGGVRYTTLLTWRGITLFESKTFQNFHWFYWLIQSNQKQILILSY